MNPISRSDLMQAVFFPRSVAVVGASRDSSKERWTRLLLDFGYQGRIYPINPQASEILGLKAYPSLHEVPEAVDYAIVAVPRTLVPKAVRECVDRGVRVAHVFTAGFAELDEEGKQLQAEIGRIISGSDTRVIGPNCFGVYSPAGGLPFETWVSPEVGSIGLVSQSGQGAHRVVYTAGVRGLRFSKAVSLGNAVDLGIEDFLELLAFDEETRVIVAYVEGVTDGKRFFATIREAARVKPVVLLVGGLSESGSRAAASHTGSMAGSKQVWDAFFRQTGAIRVATFDEVIDMMEALHFIPRFKGKGVGLVTRGGGFGVTYTDLIEDQGLLVPELSPKTLEELARTIPTVIGSAIRNPVEIGFTARGIGSDYVEGLQVVASDPAIDVVLTLLNPVGFPGADLGNWPERVSAAIEEAAKKVSKPLVIAFARVESPDVLRGIHAVRDRCHALGMACFVDMDPAVKALGNLVRYYQFLDGQNGEI